MELVYLWVEDYKNIKKQGFNFSPQFECKFYDEYNENRELKDNCKLEIKPKEHIENFFGDNINVTAIVGKNGSGKSAILELLTNSLSESYEKDNMFGTEKSKFFLIYKYEGTCYLVKVNFFSSVSHEKIREIDVRLFSEHKELISILLNNELAIRKIFNEGERLFISNTQFNKNYIQQIICSNFINNRNASFYKNFEAFFIPTKIKITSNYRDSNGHIEKITSYIEKMSINEAKNEIKELEKDYDSSDKKGILKIIENATPILLNTFNQKDMDDNKLKKIFSLKSKLINIEISNNTKNFKDLSYGERQLLTNLNFILFYSQQKEYITGEQSYYEDTDTVDEHRWSEKVNNILVLLDEFELGLHPDWQKKSIKYIIDFLKNIDKNFHLIITSHSPFIISDLPKQNIVFLDTYKEDDNKVKNKKQKLGNCKVLSHNEVLFKKQTFGANIHTLLSDSFFMEDGLMGEFAKGKINEIIDFHKEVEEENKKEKTNFTSLKTRYEKHKTKFWQTQSIIGEDYLKQVIKNHLRDIESILFGYDEAKKEEIKRLREEADRLEKM